MAYSECLPTCLNPPWLRGPVSPRFEIRNTQGPDETERGISNQSSMNMVCAKVLEAAVAAARRYGLGSEHELETWRWAREHFVFAYSTGEPTSLLPSEGSPCNGPGSPIHLECNRTNYQVGMVAYLWNHGIPDAINASVLHATWALEERLRNIEQTCPPNLKGTTPLPGPWCYSNVPTTELTPGFTVPPFYAMAAHFGDRSTALELWRRMPVHFMRGPWGLFCEYDCRWAGNIYLTTAASVLQSTMFGVSGLRPWSLATNLSDASPDSFVHCPRPPGAVRRP